MRAITQYQVYNGDTGEVIETYVNRADAYSRVDHEFVHGAKWAAVRTITVKHFKNTIFNTI